MAAPKKQPLDHLRKEAGAPEGPFATAVIHGRLGDAEVEILDPLDWAFDVQDLIQQALFSAVFDGIMDEKNAEKAKAVRPTMKHAMDFMQSLEDIAGSSPGESQAS